MQDVLFDTRGALGIITLNRPKALNALTEAMCQAMRDGLTHFEQDKRIAAVVIQGEGERAFCAGGDIRHLYQCHLQQTPELADSFIYHEYHLNQQIAAYSKPYIALIHGLTMGGGAGVSVHGRRRYASDNIVWAMPETAIGLFPDIGASYFLSRCGAVGRYLALTGARVDASALEAIGLVDAVIPHDTFKTLLAALVELDLTYQPLNTIDTFIQHLAKPRHTHFPEQALIESCFNQPSVETIMQALLEANTAFTLQTHEDLTRRSPTSLKITFEALKRGATLDLSAALAQEYRMAYRCMRGHDLFEGIRAAIIDKDQQPKWLPAQLADVSPEEVARYFESPVNLWD